MKWAVFTPAGAHRRGSGLAATWAMADGAASSCTILVAVLCAGVAHLTVDVRDQHDALSRFADPASSATIRKAIGPARFCIAVPLYTPLVAFLVIAYEQYSPWIVATFLMPALAAQRVCASIKSSARLRGGSPSANRALEEANISFAAALVATLDARDRYTAGHSAAVAIYSRDIAARMGLSEAEQQQIHLAGLVHDIGKIGLLPGLLEKEGPLTLEERRVMQTHSEIGERILAKVEDYGDIAEIVRHHHERVDGHGYPDGLSSR